MAIPSTWMKENAQYKEETKKSLKKLQGKKLKGQAQGE